MQTLLKVVQEFTTWFGMQINVKKTYLLVIDNDEKRRASATIDNQRSKASIDESR